ARYNCQIKDVFEKKYKYLYKLSILDFLSEKTALFLLDYFYEIFKNCGKSKIEKKNQYKLATLGEIVDSKCLPAGYSTSLEYSCHYCKEYYKRRIYNNVNFFLKRLEKGPNILTTEEKKGENVEDIANEDDEKAEEIETNKSQQVHVAFINALNQIGI
ncbi:16787_t:CDS:2, partial [Funneliformis caledonium]